MLQQPEVSLGDRKPSIEYLNRFLAEQNTFGIKLYIFQSVVLYIQQRLHNSRQEEVQFLLRIVLTTLQPARNSLRQSLLIFL
jgi:hypothetical protein